MQSPTVCFAILGLILSAIAAAEQPVGWRTDGTGVYTASDPPTQWSKDKNIVWSTDLPSRSNAQPLIVGDRVFVCAEPFLLMCLHREDGRVLWQRENAYGDLFDEAKASQLTVPKTQRQYNGYTTATATSDGQHIWAVFGNQTVVCYDLAGQLRWAEVMPDKPQAVWGHSSSPLLVGDKLIVSIEDIVALDAASGKEVWRTRYGQTWGSPVRARIGSEELILMANGRLVRAADGRILVRVSGLDRGSPIALGRNVYYVGIGADAYLLPDAIGDSFELKELWSTDTKGGEFYGSAVVHDGLVYAASTQKILNVIDAATGEPVYVRRLSLGRDPVWPSLCVAGNYLYVSSRDGTTIVLETGREYKEVARNELEFFISTPVFHENRLYIRTNERLYCIGKS